MPFLAEADCSTGLVSADAADERGKELANKYRINRPFPHVVIDDFLPPSVLDICLDDFPKSPSQQFNRPQERLKVSYNPDTLSPRVRAIFYAFNSLPFIRVIENISGIKGLVGDPYFSGGGFHELRQGGHLSVHADFNHHRPMNMERRVNVLIYLNKDWKDEYGGQLELWENDMSNVASSIVPLFNRCVIFNTTSNSMHGNPQPINHPDLGSRKSIALYYYTATWDGSKRSHTTQFQNRPSSADKTDWQVKIHETLTDVVPPIALRAARNLKKMIKNQRGENYCL